MTHSLGKSYRAGRIGRWFLAAAAVAATTVMLPKTASAQGWLADRRYTEGAGIRTGDLELHPGIGGEVGYDSNWFLRSSESGPNILNGDPNAPRRDALVFRVTPSFYVSTLSAQRSGDGAVPQTRFVTFRGGASATARFFIGKELSDQHNVSVNADARMDLNQGNPVAFSLFGVYGRVIQPNVLADPNLAFNRDDIKVGAEARFLPGGGNLELAAGYSFTGSLYEETQGIPYNSTIHEISFRDRWKFRPRTALFSQAALDFINYPNAPRSLFLLNDATPLRTSAGVTGLVTNWLGTTLSGGYSATFFKEPQLPSSRQYDSFNAQAEATFYIGNGSPDLPGEATLLLSSFAIGFQRDFQRSLVGNFYGSNRLYAKLQYWFGGRVVLDLHVAGEQLNYPTVFLRDVPAAVTPDYTNYRVSGGMFAEYRFSQQFGLNTTVEYTRQFSDTQLPVGANAAGVPQVFDQNYGRFQAFLGFRYFY